MDRINLIGYPGDIGGASTEAWHLLSLFRRAGWPVRAIPTWKANPKWRSLCDSIGVETVEVEQGRFDQVPDLAGETVVSLCNSNFLKHYGEFKTHGCKLVWLNCMTFPWAAEKAGYQVYGPPDVLVCQSEYQRGRLASTLAQYGVAENRFRVIRGAFDFLSWEFRPTPHEPRSAFWVGRCARSDPAKWSSNTWKIYDRICYAKRRALMLGMEKRTHDKLGPKPTWAECWGEKKLDIREFYARLHCLLPINGGAHENWPRAGLEAMAVGVPVVAQNQWGWKEMVVHGETGFLGDADDELAHYAGMLAHDERLRIRIAENARRRLEEELANPEKLTREWEGVLVSLRKEAAAP